MSRAGPRHDLAQDMRVSAMDSVKIAHADKRGPEVGGEFLEFVKHEHRNDG